MCSSLILRLREILYLKNFKIRYLKYLFVLCAVFFIIQFAKTTFESYTESRYLNFCGRSPNSTQTIVLIFGLDHAESSRLGEYLSEEFDSLYLKEPLFIVDRHCNILKNEKNEWLKQLLSCNFDEVENSFRYNFYLLDKNLLGCGNSSMCIAKYRNHFFNREILECDIQLLNVSLSLKSPSSALLSKVCRKSSTVIIQVSSLCQLRTRERFFKEIVSESRINLRVIHLVSDPRSYLLPSTSEVRLVYCCVSAVIGPLIIVSPPAGLLIFKM